MTSAASPCFAIPAGGSMTLDAPKVISVLEYDGVPRQAGPYYDYLGDFANGGVRQVASVDGTSYYISGTSSEYWGLRYLPSVTANASVIVSGQDDGQPGALLH
jgi:hypothetical protein